MLLGGGGTGGVSERGSVADFRATKTSVVRSYQKIRGHLNSSQDIRAYPSFCTISAPLFALFGKGPLIIKHLRKKLRHGGSASFPATRAVRAILRGVFLQCDDHGGFSGAHGADLWQRPNEASVHQPIHRRDAAGAAGITSKRMLNLLACLIGFGGGGPVRRVNADTTTHRSNQLQLNRVGVFGLCRGRR